MLVKEYSFKDYDVTYDGIVYSLKHNRTKMLKQSINGRGYLLVSISDSGKIFSVAVHQMVACKYLPPKPSHRHEIRHLDGNKTNNNANNLAWGTSKENSADTERHGRAARGASHGRARLTQEQVDRIRFLDGKVQPVFWSRLALSLGVTKKTISDVARYRTWKKK